MNGDSLSQGCFLGEKRPSKRVSSNPLRAGIQQFLSRFRPDWHTEDIPKRFTRYGSFLLLGATFTSHSTPWRDLYQALGQEEKSHLFRSIASQFPDHGVTHIAMNAPIMLTTDGHEEYENHSGRMENENVMRSPVGLVPLWGDFGPNTLMKQNASDTHRHPEAPDFDAAYWARTIQLRNIVQVWAPRWTMFSRGNISEKARILQDGANCNPFPGLQEDELGCPSSMIDVVDFYIGIGYFALCYLSRGVRRVWGWEINGWSVEGLRRGCLENGYAIKVVKLGDTGMSDDHDHTLSELIRDVCDSDSTPDPIRCVVFWGDNRWASRTMAKLRIVSQRIDPHLDVRHCNLGLLPSSRKSWSQAIEVLAPDKAGWLHVHENVDVGEIEQKAREISQELQRLAFSCTGLVWTASCQHVERVKTYAPGVMHCVFDIKLYPNR